MMHRNTLRFAMLAVTLVLAPVPGMSPTARAADESYYKVRPVFIPYPEPGKDWNIRQYGPVGIGIDLVSPAFTVRIKNVEKGSPAEAAGGLKGGEIIESINGQTLKDKDPRVQLADILTEAETTDGLMVFKIKDGDTVTVKLPIMGRYSKTWPLNCPKSDKIVRNFGDRCAGLAEPDWSAAPFLLSTGEDKDLETVRRWFKTGSPAHEYPWYIGYHGVAACEFYLRTGDSSVIPSINQMSAKLKASMYNGSWMGRGSEAPNFGYMAGGHMNAAGVHALNFLLLAKECGADVDDYLLKRVLFQFFRFAGRGNVAYGDQMPEGGFRDNGKTAGLAVAMSSAASLTPGGEKSIYARARDLAAMKSFYATTWFNRAHTGGGIGEIWHGVAMQMMVNEKPVQWRSFNDERRWIYELSRKFDGSFSISDSGGGYEETGWGNHFAMFYTAARKKLRMFGAPKTEWCKTYQLPERPWGTPADDVYQSLRSAELEPGKFLDISEEVITTDASGPWMSNLGTNATDEKLVACAHHPEYAFRSGVAQSISGQGRTHLIVPLLKHKDPRVREVGVLTMAGMFKGTPIPVESITDEMYGLLAGMINDPDESQWVALNAMKALERLPENKIVPLVDRLIYFLKMDDWWMQSAALGALSKVAADKSVYKKVIPAIGNMAARNTDCCTFNSASDLPKVLAAASPEVQELALATFTGTYNAIPDPLFAPGGANLATGQKQFQDTIRSWLQSVPGGSKVVLDMPKLSSEWQASRKDSDMYVYTDFKPNAAIVGNWLTVDEAKSVKDFQEKLEKEAAQLAKEAEAKKAGKPGKKKPEPKKKNYQVASVEIKDNGAATIGRSMLKWSGNKLIQSDQVLGMEVQSIDGKEYLFLEAGGFSAAHDPEWRTSYYVMTRK